MKVDKPENMNNTIEEDIQVRILPSTIESKNVQTTTSEKQQMKVDPETKQITIIHEHIHRHEHIVKLDVNDLLNQLEAINQGQRSQLEGYDVLGDNFSQEPYTHFVAQKNEQNILQNLMDQKTHWLQNFNEPKGKGVGGGGSKYFIAASANSAYPLRFVAHTK